MMQKEEMQRKVKKRVKINLLKMDKKETSKINLTHLTPTSKRNLTRSKNS